MALKEVRKQLHSKQRKSEIPWETFDLASCTNGLSAGSLLTDKLLPGRTFFVLDYDETIISTTG